MVLRLKAEKSNIILFRIAMGMSLFPLLLSRKQTINMILSSRLTRILVYLLRKSLIRNLNFMIQVSAHFTVSLSSLTLY